MQDDYTGLQVLDWTTGLEHWTGLLDWVLFLFLCIFRIISSIAVGFIHNLTQYMATCRITICNEIGQSN